MDETKSHCRGQGEFEIHNVTSRHHINLHKFVGVSMVSMAIEPPSNRGWIPRSNDPFLEHHHRSTNIIPTNRIPSDLPDLVTSLKGDSLYPRFPEQQHLSMVIPLPDKDL